MTKRTVVIRKRSCKWQPNTKRKIKTTLPAAPKRHLSGFINPVFVVLACTAFSGLFYVYSINQTAVKGIAIQKAEKLISQRRGENESLKIKEAQLKSLYSIEEASKQLEMVDMSGVKYLEENSAVAFAARSKEHKN